MLKNLSSGFLLFLKPAVLWKPAINTKISKIDKRFRLFSSMQKNQSRFDLRACQNGSLFIYVIRFQYQGKRQRIPSRFDFFRFVLPRKEANPAVVKDGFSPKKRPTAAACGLFDKEKERWAIRNPLNGCWMSWNGCATKKKDVRGTSRKHPNP